MITILISCSNPTKSKKDEPTDGWKLTWSDEFNGNGEVDLTKWDKPEYNRRQDPDGPDSWWLKEDSYQDGNGNLIIQCRKINNRNNDNDNIDYSTGAIRSISKFEQKFGKFEMRAKLPTQPGWWVAFWLMSETVGNVDDSGEDGTEIDIMEGFGWTNKINHALHWDGYGDAHKSSGHESYIPGIRQGFHTYTLEWNADEYIYFIDSTEVWRTSAGGVSKVPAYVKVTGELSTLPWAIGENWSNNPAGANFPDYFIVDWVRVYQKND